MCCLQHPREALQGSEALFSAEISGPCCESMAGQVANTPLSLIRWFGVHLGAEEAWNEAAVAPGVLLEPWHTHRCNTNLGRKRGKAPSLYTPVRAGSVRYRTGFLLSWFEICLLSPSHCINKRQQGGTLPSCVQLGCFPQHSSSFPPAVSSSFLSSGIRVQNVSLHWSHSYAPFPGIQPFLCPLPPSYKPKHSVGLTEIWTLLLSLRARLWFDLSCLIRADQ